MRPLFVMGAPRSGTSVIGKYLASPSSVIDVGELPVFYFAHWEAPWELFQRPHSPYISDYLQSLQEHAWRWWQAKLDRHDYVCDSTPWNLRIVEQLNSMFPDGVFILCVRHYVGVIQSLRRSYARGYRWAGPSDEERATLWAELYEAALASSADFVSVSYDQLCLHPEYELDRLHGQLAQSGLSLTWQPDVLATSHSTEQPRPTSATATEEGVILTQRRAYEADTAEALLAEFRSWLAPIGQALNRRFPGSFCYVGDTEPSG